MTEQAKVPAIRFAGFTDPWEQRKLGELEKDATLYMGRGRVISAKDMSNTPGTFPVYSSSALDNGRMGAYGKYMFNQELITWSIDGGGAVFYRRKHRFSVTNVSGYIAVNPEKINCKFLAYAMSLAHSRIKFDYTVKAHPSVIRSLYTMGIPISLQEQQVIGSFFSRLDNLITLHQRKRESRIIRVCSFIWLAGDISGIGVSAYQPEREDRMTEGNTNAETLFCDYYEQWISVYKEGAIREVTMKKYRLTQAWLGRLIPDLKLADMDRVNYQKLINGYAEHHERQTTMDFHHQLKGAILDAVDEGLIQRDPTRKAIIKGKPPCSKKTKYLNQFELHAVLADLELGKGPSWDWLILLVAKTGLRFSEALGLTPDDFDFVHQTLSVSKTWDYKNGGGFVPTKNASSVRKVQLDWQLIMQLSTLLKDLPAGDPIFVNGKVYNSTANNILARHCERANVPVISIHGLRHTHASLLLFAGVSIASVSKRLGHASMNTTQDTYLHVIRELENKDVDIVMRALSTLI